MVKFSPILLCPFYQMFDPVYSITWLHLSFKGQYFCYLQSKFRCFILTFESCKNHLTESKDK